MMSTQTHDATCDTGQPCPMCVETARCCADCDAIDAQDAHVHNFQQVEGQSALECACGAVPDYENEPEWWKEMVAREQSDAARESRNAQDYEADLRRRREQTVTPQQEVDRLSDQLAANHQRLLPRTFPDVLNEWTDKCVELNRDCKLIEEMALITKLGILGQRLLYEAHELGQNSGLRYATERVKERG